MGTNQNPSLQRSIQTVTRTNTYLLGRGEGRSRSGEDKESGGGLHVDTGGLIWMTKRNVLACTRVLVKNISESFRPCRERAPDYITSALVRVAKLKREDRGKECIYF